MKQKIVIKVEMNCDKRRRRAMKLAASQGVDSIKLDGEKNHLEVVGDIDSVNLTRILRKKIGYSVIVEVEEVKKDGEEEKSEESKIESKYAWSSPVVLYDVADYSNSPSFCSIL